MFEISELFEQITRLKQSSGFISNSFLSANDLSRISAENDSYFCWNTSAALVIHRDNGISRVNFYLASLDDAMEMKPLVINAPSKPLVIDCVGRANHIDMLSGAVCSVGFKPYAKLGHWKSKSISFFLYPRFLDNCFRFAVEKDIDCILQILGETFDPLTSHLPSLKKLLSLIEAKSVFCAVNNGKIIAVTCLEKLGRKAVYSYQDAVLRPYQSTGIGILLLQYALYQFRECTNYTAWTEDNNLASNRMHRALGMSYDGLKDHVLIYE